MSQHWVMLMFNDGTSYATYHATQEEAYQDIIDTCYADPHWIQMDPEGPEWAAKQQHLETLPDIFRRALHLANLMDFPRDHMEVIELGNVPDSDTMKIAAALQRIRKPRHGSP